MPTPFPSIDLEPSEWRRERKRAGSPQRAKQMVSSGHSNSSGQSCLWGGRTSGQEVPKRKHLAYPEASWSLKVGSTSQRNILLLSALLKLWRFIGDLSCVFYSRMWSEFLRKLKQADNLEFVSFLIRNLMFKTLGLFYDIVGFFFSWRNIWESDNKEISFVSFMSYGMLPRFFKPDGFV